MTPLQKFIAALSALGVADMVILSAYFAWLTAQPGAEELNACTDLFHNVGVEEYRRLLDSSQDLENICGPFDLDKVKSSN